MSSPVSVFMVSAALLASNGFFIANQAASAVNRAVNLPSNKVQAKAAEERPSTVPLLEVIVGPLNVRRGRLLAYRRVAMHEIAAMQVKPFDPFA
jgi:hypothetical protein